VLHADHGFNASTFSAKVTAATLSDMHSAITSAVGTLKGPLHGGANQRVREMLDEIGSTERVPEWVTEKLAKKERIMGFGHRVYKVEDPRARHLRASAEALRASGDPSLLDISARLVDVVHEAKGLEVNVDFWSEPGATQLPGHFRAFADLRLDDARHGAVRRQQADPAAGRVCRARRAGLCVGRRPGLTTACGPLTTPAQSVMAGRTLSG